MTTRGMTTTVEPIRQGPTRRVGPSVSGAPGEGTLQAKLCVFLVIAAAFLFGAPLAAQSDICGLPPEVVFHEDPLSGVAYAVTVSGSWPTPATDVRAELESQPNADGELRLDIAGTAVGIIVVGHYERTVLLPTLPPGPYSLEVYLNFEAQPGVPFLVQYCGSYPFFGAYPVPALSWISALFFGCLLVLGAIATFQRRR